MEAIVLGCAELPLVFEVVALSADIMDVMRIHIRALIDGVVGGE